MHHWQELERKYYLQTGKRTPVTLVRGEGIWVWDDNDKKYLDFFAGIAVDSLGHCHPVVVDAVTEQVKKLIHTSNIYYTIPQIKLAKLLIENSALDRVYFANSGAEVNEGAVKLARKYGKLHLNGAYKIITALNSFHGRTLAMVAATGQEKLQHPYSPIPSGFINVTYNDIEAIKSATDGQVCAVMLEVIQGEGGINVPDDDYLKKVRSWCDEKGILLILDEIQTGVGRTGSLFAYQQYGIEPDIMTLAKGLGGGMPIGGFLATEKVSVFDYGDHGGTFCGNPVTCAAAYATLKFIIENDVCSNVQKTGAYFLARLEELRSHFNFISDVRGKGLLIALEFDSDIADDIVNDCLNNGLLMGKLKPNLIRLLPPLIVTEKEVDKAVGIIGKVLAKV